jgi:peptidoglycan/LPS O-acetylase OafA/YrhL
MVLPNVLPAHTGIRGLAALAVVLFHFSIYWPGYLGVDLFFVLSGFIIHHVYRERFGDRVRIRQVVEFLRYRLARIYPMHVATTLAAVAFSLLAAKIDVATRSGGAISVEGLVASLLLVHGWFNIPGPNYISWSVSAEWFAYLIYPVVALLATRLSKLIKYATLIPLSLLLHFYADLNPVARVVPEFILGMAAYAMCLQPTVRASLNPWSGLLVVAFIALVEIALSSAILVSHVLLFAALLIALTSSCDHFGKILSCAPLVYLGEISYSIYLTHSLIRSAVLTFCQRFDFDAAAAIVVVISISLVIVISSLAYHLIELPARRLLRGRKAGVPQEAILVPSPAAALSVLPSGLVDPAKGHDEATKTQHLP